MRMANIKRGVVMEFMKNQISSIKENILGYKHYKAIILGIVLSGILAHGEFLFEKKAVHDEIYAMFGTGISLTGGRWMLFLLGKLTSELFGDGLYSLTMINSCLAFICVACAVIIVSVLYKIESDILIFLMTTLAITIPAMTSALGFTYGVPYSMFGMLLAVCGSFVLCRKDEKNLSSQTIINSFIGILLVTCSIGVGQNLLGMSAAIILGYWSLSLVNDTRQYSWIQFIKDGLYYLFVLVASLVGYLVANSIMLKLTHCELSTYQGINNYGIGSINDYLNRLIHIYKEFFVPTQSTVSSYTGILKPIYELVVVIFAIYVIWTTVDLMKTDKARAMMHLIVIAVFPVAENLISLIVDPRETHLEALVYFPQICFFFLVAGLISLCEVKSTERRKSGLKKCAVVMLSIMVLANIRYDNICYMYADIEQNHAISYMQTLADRIQSMDGYTDQLPVVYINEYDKTVPQNSYKEQFADNYIVAPYGLDWINNYIWQKFMSYWVGYEPEVLDFRDSGIRQTVIDEMPNYPNDGSIQIIDDKIIVKF